MSDMFYKVMVSVITVIIVKNIVKGGDCRYSKEVPIEKDGPSNCIIN